MTPAEKNTCPFCAIVAGELDADIVHHDDSVVAFLDRRPVFPGHVLVCPSRHVEELGDMAAEEIADVVRVVRAATMAMQSALGAQGSFVGQNNVVSQSVPHVHFHVIPRTRGDGLKGFFWPRVAYEGDEQRLDFAERVRTGIATALH